MNKIPIAFAFDNNLLLPACVCISSLMMHATSDTFYDIYILHSELEGLKHEELDKLTLFYNNCHVTYIKVGDAFNDGYEVRGITKATYYRLLIPLLIPQYDKIIYADVDIIFRSDLTEVYDTNIENEYIAATYDLGMILSKDGNRHIKRIGLKETLQYMQAGFILLNSRKLREDNLVEQFKALYKNDYKFQDQDILNICLLKSHKLLPFKYNMTDYVAYYINKRHDYFSNSSLAEINEALTTGTIHYNGHKPWKKYCVNFDIWWEHYRKSPFFDEKYYFDFFYKKIDEYDRLPLWKRIKILIRFFIFGKKK